MPARTRRGPGPPPLPPRATGGVQALWRSFSAAGLVLGALFLAASLTPSLIPRSFLLQGVLGRRLLRHRLRRSAVLLGGSGHTCELPLPARDDAAHRYLGAAALSPRWSWSPSLWRAAEWQNSIRAPRWTCRRSTPATRSRSWRSPPVVFVAHPAHRAAVPAGSPASPAAGSARHVPERVSQVIGIAVAVAALLLHRRRRAAARLPERRRPLVRHPRRADRARVPGARPTRSAPAAPPRWSTGRPSAGPGASSSPPARPQADIAAFTGRAAKRAAPGLRRPELAPTTAEARAAARARRRCIRVGAFDRSVLVVAVPTGTGWMDPAATDTLEYLHGGDTAIVAVQYSYLSSPLSLLVEPGFSAADRAARSSAPSTATGRRCRGTPGRGSTSTASASAPTARSSRSGCTR